MDTTVTHLGGLVVAALRTAGYAESTISQYERTILVLDRFIRDHGGEYTKSSGAVFESSTTSPRTGQFSAQRRFARMRIVALFDGLLDTGEVFLAARKRGGGGRHPAGDEFVRLAVAWESEMTERGLADATHEAYGRVTRGYLVFLEDAGIIQLEDAGADTITGFLESLLDRWATSSLHWIVSNFRPFLKFVGRTDLVDAVGLAGVRRSHPVLTIMTDADVQRVASACASPSLLTARDASITLLALLTGLRSCDIVALRLTDIDWRSQTLNLIQQKTRNPVTLPLPSVLITRLADYVLTERPDTGDDRVFLRSVAPHTPLQDHATIHKITTSVFAAAGVANPRAGSRLLRHTAASRLLAAAVALPTISAVLGHARVESTSIYLAVDDAQLVKCVLPVPAGARS